MNETKSQKKAQYKAKKEREKQRKENVKLLQRQLALITDRKCQCMVNLFVYIL